MANLVSYQYSIAICPPEWVVEYFRKLKQELREAIKDRFASVNSEAHITFNVFLADVKQLNVWENYLYEFCSKLNPFTIHLSAIGTYNNGAFFLSPDQASKEILVPIMKQFHKDSPVKLKDKSSDPHMSIGRQLTQEQLNIATSLFGDRNFDIKFICDNLAIRRRPLGTNEQYKVCKRFEFGKPAASLLF